MITQLMYGAAAICGLVLLYFLLDFMVRARVKSLVSVLARHERSLNRLRNDKIRMLARLDKLERKHLRSVK